MVHSIAVKILLAFAAGAHAQEMVANINSNVHNSRENLVNTSTSNLVDEFVNQLSNKLADNLFERTLTTGQANSLFERTLTTSSLHHADLDSTTFGKPGHFAVHAGNRAPLITRQSVNRPSKRVPVIRASRNSGDARPSMEPATPPSNSPRLERRSMAFGLAAALLAPALAPHEAGASFGSSRGAVTSVPYLNRDITLDDFEKLPPRKQAEVQGLLRPYQIKKLLNDLGEEQNNLAGQIEAARQADEKRVLKIKELRRSEDSVSDQIRKLKAEINKQNALSEENQAGEVPGEAKQVKGNPWKDKQSKMLANQLDSILAEEARIRALLAEETQLANPQGLSEDDVIKTVAAELARKQELSARIQKRESVLSALDAQPTWFNYAAAFAASCVSTLIMHPVDTIKTREVSGKGGKSPVMEDAMTASNLQGSIIGNQTTTISILPQRPILANKVQTEAPVLAMDNDVHLATHLQNGVTEYLSLYKGIQGALLKEGPPSALYLGVYEAVKAKLLALPNFAPYPLLVYLIAGALGETLGSIVRAPAESIKSRVQSGIDANTIESIQKVILDSEGRTNVARSWSASLWRDVPFGAIQLAIFESLKSFVINSPQGFIDIDVNTLMAEVLFGATGGAMGALVTVPMDVVTTRIMTQNCDENQCEESLGFLGMTRKVLDEGGPQALLTGWKARTVYWAPAIGIFLSCYCSIRQAAIGMQVFPATIPGAGLPFGN